MAKMVLRVGFSEIPSRMKRNSKMTKRLGVLVCALIALCRVPSWAQTYLTFSTGPAAVPSCSAGVLDTFAASPGTWTFGHSFRKLLAAYGGSAKQLQRTSDNTTLDIGFVGCDFNTASAASFCSLPTLSVTSTSARVAVPSGTTIFVYNNSSTIAYYKAGNSSVTATTADTVLLPNQGNNITPGANTHVAGITVAGTASFTLTNCRVRTSYDQVNSNNLVQTTQANQLGYIPSCSNGKPCMVGCATCRMVAADSATYKTAKIHQFMVTQFGINSTAPAATQTNRISLVYPTTTSAASDNVRWGLTNSGFNDQLLNGINGNGNDNSEGFGSVFLNQIYVYDFDTANSQTNYLNVAFLTGTPTATITYPNAVGLYFAGDAAGNGSLGGAFQEDLLASNTQTARASIATNQATYFGVTAPPATTTTADGFQWVPKYIGSFAQSGSPEIVNGKTFNTESASQTYSLWRASNVKTSGTTSLGDMFRFEVRPYDQWQQGEERSELDGSGSATFALNTTTYLSYAWLLECGGQTVTKPPASWNIPGQAHGVAGPVASPIYFALSGSVITVVLDDVNAYSTSSGFVVCDTWIDVFAEVRKSSMGTTDVFKLYFNGAQVLNLSGSIWATASGVPYWKYGLYRGDFGTFTQTESFRYANMQVTTTNITAQIATPLSHPQHNFLLKRDLDPSNDNTPMWLEKVA